MAQPENPTFSDPKEISDWTIPADRQVREALWRFLWEAEPKIAADFFTGIVDGMKCFDEEKGRDTLATDVQMWLFMNSDELEDLPTIAEVYRKYEAAGEGTRCSKERFTQICRRLGMHLAPRGRPRHK